MYSCSLHIQVLVTEVCQESDQVGPLDPRHNLPNVQDLVTELSHLSLYTQCLIPGWRQDGRLPGNYPWLGNLHAIHDAQLWKTIEEAREGEATHVDIPLEFGDFCLSSIHRASLRFDLLCQPM